MIRGRLVGTFVSLLPFIAFAVPIQWTDGSWDDGGRPNGALLTANPGWWGRSGAEIADYRYEEPVTVPQDRIRDEPGTFGRRLLDGDMPTGWHRPVGVAAGKSIRVVFDLKRASIITEVDCLSTRTTNSAGRVEFSSDGHEWSGPVIFSGTGRVVRVVAPQGAKARYVRIAFRAVVPPGANPTNTFLDEVLIWGETTGLSPEDLPYSVLPLDALRMSDRRDGSISLYPVPDPGDQRETEPKLPDSSSSPLAQYSFLMARNEVESRYFAVINESEVPCHVALEAPVFGEGVSAELLIAGLVRSDPPSRKLTEKELFDMLLTEQRAESVAGKGKRSFLPFFTEGNRPDTVFLRRYIANPDQVEGFPRAVPLAPGEGMLLMLRVRTLDAKPGVKKSSFLVHGKAIPFALTIADVRLSVKRPWVYAWSPFTRQYPFESSCRIIADAEAMMELGVTHYMTWPAKGTRGHYIMRRMTESTFGTLMTNERVFHEVYNGKNDLTAEDYAVISNALDSHAARLREIGLSPDRFIVELPDEPGERNALGVGRMAEWSKKCHPEINIFCDPSFWTKRGCFADAETVVSCLNWFYNDCVDVSIPYRSNMEDPVKRAELFCRKRKINAQYAHPARRAGRSIAWSSFRYGLDGFGYWAYFTPRGNPWDIRTWGLYDFEQAQMVFPLENGVAITAMYETMREAVEDFRLLTAVREAGKDEVLSSVLAEFASFFDPVRAESSRPYRCDFNALRDRLLKLFVQ